MAVQINEENAEQIGRPTIEGILDAHVTADYNRLVELLPGMKEEDFSEAVTMLSPMGKVASVDYLGHLNKIGEHLLLWKVRYELGEEDILWHLALEEGETQVRPVGLFFDL